MKIPLMEVTAKMKGTRRYDRRRSTQERTSYHSSLLDALFYVKDIHNDLLLQETPPYLHPRAKM
jgi:hypothetical protein